MFSATDSSTWPAMNMADQSFASALRDYAAALKKIVPPLALVPAHALLIDNSESLARLLTLMAK